MNQPERTSPRRGIPPHAAYELRPSPLAGMGLFAIRDIAVGERLVEYVGERITHEEAERRYDDERMDVHHTFLFAIDDEWCIDAAVGGNESRFINHSCEPNCDAIDDDGRIWIEAIRDIAEGEELVYDYSYVVDERLTHEDARRLYPCRCRTPSCNLTIAKVLTPGEDQEA